MKLSIIYFLIFLFPALTSLAQDTINEALDDDSMVLYDRIPDGISKAAFVVDTIMYLGNGAALDIYGIANPSQPNKLGRLVTPGLIKKIFIKNNLAFIAEMRNGIFIADISNHAEPVMLGSYKYHTWAHPDGLAEDVFVQGNYAYIAYGVEGLRVLDISDPANPNEVGAILNDSQNLTYAYAVDVSGDYAYVANGGYGMNIIDVSDPAAMTQVGAYENSGTYPTVNDICVTGTMAFLSADWRGLVAVDFSDPENPYKTDAYSPGNLAISVFAEGDYAYITEAAAYLEPDSTVGLTVLDVSDPQNIVGAGEYVTKGHPYSIFIKDSLAFIADGNNGLLIIVPNPSNTNTIFRRQGARTSASSSEAGHISVIGETKSCFGLSNGTIGGVNGLSLHFFEATLNIPLEVNFDNPIFDAVSNENHVYVAEGNSISIIDLSVDPIFIIGHEFSQNFNAIDVGELFVGTAVSDDGFDFSWTVQPVYDEDNGGAWMPSDTFFPLTENPAAICTEGDNVFIFTQEFGPTTLFIFNAADLDNPIQISSAEINSDAFINSADYCDSKLLYCGASPFDENEEIIGIIDVSDPASPVLIGEQSFEGSGEDIECSGLPDKCVVAEGENGFSLFDFSDPGDIQKVDNQQTGDKALSSFVSMFEPYPPGGNSNTLTKTNSDSSVYIYVADDGDGVYIYKYDIATSVGNRINLPNKFELYQNYPNPFGKSSSAGNSFTTIKYSIPNVGDANFSSPTNVQLKIYDLLGREVATLVNEKQAPGNYEAKFNASGLPSGVYFYRLQSGANAQTKKMILMR